MTRRPALVTQADVARALRAAEQVAPGRFTVEVTAEGVIRIVPTEPCSATPAAPAPPPDDDLFAPGLESIP